MTFNDLKIEYENQIRFAQCKKKPVRMYKIYVKDSENRYL